MHARDANCASLTWLVVSIASELEGTCFKHNALSQHRAWTFLYNDQKIILAGLVLLCLWDDSFQDLRYRGSGDASLFFFWVLMAKGSEFRVSLGFC